MPKLIRGQVGNTLVIDAKPRLASVMADSPNLERTKVDQIAALPLGGRIKLDPWTGKVEISKARSVALLNAREKMPFEVTPVFPFITRLPAASRAVTPVPVSTSSNVTSNGAQ
jgi:hypothetical protein